MSHSVVVVVGDPDKLEEMLAPFDENAETEPYRSYAEGPAGEFWAVEHLQQEGHLPEDVPKDALTWKQVVDAYRAKYGAGIELKYDADEDRAYEMSTYPKTVRGERGIVSGARWDWYSVGGRWTGYFRLKKGQLAEVGRPGLMTPAAKPGYADIVQKRQVDFEGMRAEARAEAERTWDAARAVLDPHPQPESWESLRTRFTEQGLDIDEARKAYHSQPAVQALRAKIEQFGFRSPEEFSGDKEAYVKRAEDSAFVPFAFLVDGEWIERGKMGWFGMTMDEAEPDDWNTVGAEIFDSLPDDTWLTAVDVHI